MSGNTKGGFKYIRYMRDGSQKEITALVNQEQRVRKGKTEKDRANIKRVKV
jgi:hypothetical protein